MEERNLFDAIYHSLNYTAFRCSGHLVYLLNYHINRLNGTCLTSKFRHKNFLALI
jgi:hypothetical protein